MQITATVRLARPGAEAEVFTRQFSALPSALDALIDWLRGYQVSAAVLEAGIYWEAPWQALERAGIKPLLVHAQHVKQIKGRKTDIADSLWLARICQFALCAPSMVPPAQFRTLRKVSRMRRQVVRERARLRNRIHKILDAAGIRIGGILSDLWRSSLRFRTTCARGWNRCATPSPPIWTSTAASCSTTNCTPCTTPPSGSPTTTPSSTKD